MISINPFDVFLWTFRKNEKDVINLYNTLSPVMQIATGGTMLNFGYWSSQHLDPISAQENLCHIFGNLSELSTAKNAIDVGSGLSAPSKFWRDAFPNLKLYDVNINFRQLCFSKHQKNIQFLNSTSTKLPFMNNSVDRVLALESAQHFKPLDDFIVESKRVLIPSGFLVMAIPITISDASLRKLGLLKFTWSSEHYSLDYLKNLLISNGFKIIDEPPSCLAAISNEILVLVEGFSNIIIIDLPAKGWSRSAADLFKPSLFDFLVFTSSIISLNS